MRLALVVAATLALGLTAPSARACLEAVSSPTGDPVAPVVAMVWLVALGIATWLGGVALVAAAARVPGRVGATSSALLRRVAPQALRIALVATTGTAGLTAVAVPAGAAEAAPRPSVSAITLDTSLDRVSLDWPGADTQDPAPLPSLAPSATGPPTPTESAAPLSAPLTGPALAGAHMVVAGDTLWDLAATSLGPSATPAQVATAWPAWWSANRDAVGDDPHLLRPGTRLVPPA